MVFASLFNICYSKLISNRKSTQIVYELKAWTEIYFTYYLVCWPFHYSYALSQNRCWKLYSDWVCIRFYLITEDHPSGLRTGSIITSGLVWLLSSVITDMYVHQIIELHNQVFMQDLCQRDKVLTVQHCNRCTASGCKNIQTPHSKLFNKCWDCTIEALKSHSTFLF